MDTVVPGREGQARRCSRRGLVVRDRELDFLVGRVDCIARAGQQAQGHPVLGVDDAVIVAADGAYNLSQAAGDGGGQWPRLQHAPARIHQLDVHFQIRIGRARIRAQPRVEGASLDCAGGRVGSQ